MSPLVTRRHPLRQRIWGQKNGAHTFAICVPVLTEALFGIGMLPRITQNVAELAMIRPRLDCYPLEEIDAEVAAQLQVSLRRQGRQLHTVDALIAAIALRYDMILLTTDKDFGAIPNLRCENWLKV